MYFKNFVLPYKGKEFSEKTKGKSLREEVEFYFRSKGFSIRRIRIENPRQVKHKLNDKIFYVEAFTLAVELSAPDKEKLYELFYNGIGWLSSQGFGYAEKLRKPLFSKGEKKDVDKSRL